MLLPDADYMLVADCRYDPDGRSMVGAGFGRRGA